MEITPHLKLINSLTVADLTKERVGETKVGQVVKTLSSIEDLDSGQYNFALLGVEEDIGPRANLGQPGATGAWSAFLDFFLNQQSNSLFFPDDVLLLGHIDCSDLTVCNDLTDLRNACADIDQRVHAAVAALQAREITPIVIGGGHNNAFPIIQAVSQANQLPLAVCNLDPHSDFREVEGRHSGNPFRYAFNEGYLAKYAVLGLHEQKNNQHALDALAKEGFPYFSIQQTHWANSHNFDQCLEEVGRYLLHSGLPIGIELDLDAIKDMPTSAMTTAGLSLNDALYYICQMASLPNVQYLHLAEGAPQRHASGLEEGRRVVGQALCEMVSMFIKTQYALEEQ